MSIKWTKSKYIYLSFKAIVCITRHWRLCLNAAQRIHTIQRSSKINLTCWVYNATYHTRNKQSVSWLRGSLLFSPPMTFSQSRQTTRKGGIHSGPDPGKLRMWGLSLPKTEVKVKLTIIMHPFYHHMISSSFLGIHICFKHVFKHYCSITFLCCIRVKMGPDKGDKDLSIEIWSGPWTIRSISSVKSWTTASLLKKYGVYFYPQFKVSPPLTLASDSVFDLCSEEIF